MNKKLPVVKVTPAESASRLENLQLDTTVPLAGIAGAIKDGLLAFSAAAGLVVMNEMMTGGDERDDDRRAHGEDWTQARQAG